MYVVFSTTRTKDFSTFLLHNFERLPQSFMMHNNFYSCCRSSTISTEDKYIHITYADVDGKLLEVETYYMEKDKRKIDCDLYFVRKTPSGQQRTLPFYKNCNFLHKIFSSCSRCFLIYLLVMSVSIPGTTGLQAISCYSCMSPTYKTHWEYFKNTYFPPEAFTPDCNQPFKKQNVPEILCNSVCLVIANPVYMAGRYIGNDIIRGCFNRIMRWGWNNTTMMEFENYDICRNIKNSQMIKESRFNFKKRDDDSTAHICSCYHDRCNDGTLINGSRSVGTVDLRVLVIFILFICRIYAFIWT